MSRTLRLSSLYLAWYLASSAPAAMPRPAGAGLCLWRAWAGGGDDMMARADVSGPVQLTLSPLHALPFWAAIRSIQF